MGLCPGCSTDTALLSNPATCTAALRQKTISRILFFPCGTELPDPIEGNIAPLFEDGTIVASKTLANIVWNDPTTEDVIIDECSPAQRVIMTREMTFEDRNGVSYTSGSPATTDEYFDYTFWQDKLDKQTLLAYMIVYCDGDVVIARDKNGSLLTASLYVFLSWQKPTTQGGAWIEFKKGSIIFQGDPMSLRNKPSFNLIEEGINI